MKNIFDTHSHYLDSSFDEDRISLIQSMPSLGVNYIMFAADCIKASIDGIELANKFDYTWTSIGIHPESANDFPPDYMDTLRELSKNSKVKAIGEIGLDYHYEGFNRERQIELFENQLILAKELDLPVILHVRDATLDAMEILRKHRPRGVMHCFSGSAETAKEVLDLGLSISFTGVLTFKNAKRAIEALKVIPLDRLMLETDCPYMAPEPWRGKRCDSSMIASVAVKAGEIKGVDPQELVDIATENGLRLFGIDIG